jgi:hypothetical protein
MKKHTSGYARSLIEASLDPLVTISSKGKIMDLNQATADIIGLSKEEITDSDFFDYFTEPAKMCNSSGGDMPNLCGVTILLHFLINSIFMENYTGRNGQRQSRRGF